MPPRFTMIFTLRLPPAASAPTNAAKVDGPGMAFTEIVAK